MNRITNNDKNWGPFTIARWRGRIAFEISSGDDEDPESFILLILFGWAFRMKIPRILQPFGKWGEHPRSYGMHLCRGIMSENQWDHFGIHYGPQTMDSSTTKSWSCSVPWTDWRHVRSSVYLPDGSHYADEKRGRGNWDAWYKLRQEMPKVYFKLQDYDGTEIVAECYIEEMEWLKGDGWFKWLSLFAKPKVRRSLDMHFDKELGPGKHDWKGGTVGMGCEMLPGDTPQMAFERFCSKDIRGRGGRHYGIKFLGPCDKPQPKPKCDTDTNPSGQCCETSCVTGKSSVN